MKSTAPGIRIRRRKRLLGLATLGLAVLAWAWLRPSPVPFSAVKGLPVRVILTPPHFREIGDPASDFEVSPDGSVLVLAKGAVLATRHERGGRVSVVRLVNDPIPGLKSLAIDPEGALVTLSREGLKQVHTSDRSVVSLASIPGIDSHTHLSQSSVHGRVYLYGGDSDENGFRSKIVSISSDGRTEEVVKASSAITAVCDARGTLYFSTDNEIFALRQNELRLVIRVPAASRIISLAAEPEGEVVFFSTADNIYVLRGLGPAVEMVKGLGGTLRFRNGALYAFDAPRRVLVRLGSPNGESTVPSI